MDTNSQYRKHVAKVNGCCQDECVNTFAVVLMLVTDLRGWGKGSSLGT